MKKSWHLIPKILSGEKSIESRWYQTKRTPWNKINQEDVVYFKNSGEPVTALARVSRVLQFEIQNTRDAEKIIQKYGKKICLLHKDLKTWKKLPRYCVLVFLTKPQELEKPFQINKTGFGNATAWLSVPNIKKIQIT